MTSHFEILAECPVTRARAGLLHTAHGTIETPIFMPVGTQGTVKGLTPKQLYEDLKAPIILGNTYHLYLRPGHELIAQFGGLHSFINWPNAILTDSGGYQVFSLAGLRKISEEGVEFQSHIDGSKHFFSPESVVDTQVALGSDVMMVLDECTEYPAERSRARQSMELSIRWAERAFKHRRAEHSASTQLLFPIVQGSTYPDLRRECANRLLDLDAPGYAVGGLSVGEPRDLSYEMVQATEDILPRDKPRYVMGVGMLDELGEYVAQGADMMDCVLPTRNARNGYLFTSTGKVVIKNAAHAREDLPVDPNCKCYTCKNFSRAYLRHLFLAKELLFSTLATLHNLQMYLDRMRQIREAILVGDLPVYLNQIRSTTEQRQRDNTTSERIVRETDRGI